MQEAVAESTIIPIMQSFKIAAYNRDTTAVVFDVTEMFVGDNKRMDPFDPYGKTAGYGLLERKATLNKALTYVDSFKAFEDNISIRTMMTYKEVLTREKFGLSARRTGDDEGKSLNDSVAGKRRYDALAFG